MRPLTCALALALAACGGPAAAPTTPPPAPAAAAPVEPRQPGDPELIDPGAEPRVLLRTRVAAGTRRRFEIAVDTTMTIGGSETVMPTMVMRGDYEVLATDALDRMIVRSRFTDADAVDRPGTTPAMVEQVRQALAIVVGAVTRTTFSDRGELLAEELEAGSDAAAAQLQGALGKQAGVVLPIEPVGIGARWIVREEREQNGVTMAVEVELELLSIEGSDVAVRGTMRLGQVRGADGATYEGGGAGRFEYQLDLASYEFTSSGQMELAIDAGGTELRMAMGLRASAR